MVTEPMGILAQEPWRIAGGWKVANKCMRRPKSCLEPERMILVLS